MNKKYAYICLFLLFLMIIIVFFYIKKGSDLIKLNNMKKDIELLEDKVAIYYLNNGNLPVREEKIDFKSKSCNPNDSEIFYVIDFEKIDNLNTNYGKKKLSNHDIYIVNQETHTIYYYPGIKYENKIYYTKNEDFPKIVLENYQ